MSTPILTHWTRSDDEKKQAALDLSVKRLKAAADAYMVEAAQEKLDAEAALASALAKAEKSPTSVPSSPLSSASRRPS